MSEIQTILNYEGPIEFEVVETLLHKVKTDLKPHDIKKVLKKRVYNIIVECVENILKHNAPPTKSNFHPYIVLKKAQDSFLVIAGNLIADRDIDPLKQRLEAVKNLDKSGLQDLYEKQITSAGILEQEGAGLGIITIAQKSYSSIDYSFSPVENGLSVYELRVTVPFNKEL